MFALERNLVGKRFGKLVVLARTFPNGLGQRQWECTCDCGNKRIARESALLNGQLKTCGKHSRVLDLTGMRFGKLVVVELSHLDKNKQSLWLCKCDCGNTTVTRGNTLHRGRVKSCGCYYKEVVGKQNEKSFGVASFNTILRGYKNSAKDRNICFELTTDEFRKLIQQDCYYCGCPPQQQRAGASNGNILYNGVDRVDNSKGYVVDNVVACCGKCNVAKRAYTLDDFKTWAKSLYEHLHLENYSAEGSCIK